MKSHVHLAKEAEELQKAALGLREAFADEAVIQRRAAQDWFVEATRFHAWYFRAAQLMTDSGFSGLGKFQALCEDDRFSLFDFYTTLALGRKLQEGWREELDSRLLQMHLILGALPVAVGSAAERGAAHAGNILDRLGEVTGAKPPQ